MSNLQKRLGLAIGLLILIGVGVLLKHWRDNFMQRQQVSRVDSPSGKVTVEIIDRQRFDYNLDVYVTWNDQAIRKCIFQSPDEGLPIERRVIFAADHPAFAIVGRNYFVDQPAKLKDGQCLYLLYDGEADKLWCNAMQGPKMDRWTMADAIRLGFTQEQILGTGEGAGIIQSGWDSLNR